MFNAVQAWRLFIQYYKDSRIKEMMKLWNCENEYYFLNFLEHMEPFLDESCRLCLQYEGTTYSIIQISTSNSRISFSFQNQAFSFEYVPRKNNYFSSCSTFQSECAIIKYNESCVKLWMKHMNHIINSLNSLFTLLDTKPTRRIVINYFSSASDLAFVSGRNRVDGFFDPMSGEVNLCADIPYINHELVHAITYCWQGWPQSVVHEGIAEAFSSPLYSNELIAKINHNVYPNLSVLVEESNITIGNYCELGFLFYYIYDTLGITPLKTIYLKSNAAIMQFILEDIFRKNIELIEVDWHCWLKDLARKYNGGFERVLQTNYKET